MRVTVLSFGVLKDFLGLATEQVELPEGSTVTALLRILEHHASNLPMNSNVWQSLAVAVNREYSALDTVLREADEVALLPPVSGGGAR